MAPNKDYKKPGGPGGDSGGYNNEDDRTDVRVKESRENDIIDSKYGFDRMTVGEKTAYLINMHSTEVVDDNKRLMAAVDYYFIQEDGSRLDHMNYIIFIIITELFLQVQSVSSI